MKPTSRTDREIFDLVVEISDPAERAGALVAACGGNHEQAKRVQALLDAFAEAGGFLETSQIGGATTKPVITGISETAGSVIGNYKLLQEIGSGGFGVVYLAEQRQPVKRQVALKIIKPGMDTREVVGRFEAERQALALMSHVNIAQVYDGGSTDSGRPFFVMELVRGIPITEFCDRNKLSTSERLNLFLQVCAAVQHAHQKGIIHRDIKPSNVLITSHEGVPVPKVIDFGIAKALHQELTEKSVFTAYGQMIGTPQYASPEQAEMSGLDIDTRSDIYSLGVLLYELLTGETPISRDEIRKAGFKELLRLIQEKEPTKPSMALSASCRTSTTVSDSRSEEPRQLIHQVEGDLDWIVLRALEKDRTRRYGTASDFANDVRNYLNHEPVSASPPTVRYLARKYWQRNRKPLLAIVSIMVILLLGIASTTTLYFRASSAEQLAVKERETAVSESRRAEAEKQNAQEARDAEINQRQIAQDSLKTLKKTLARADFDTAVTFLDRGNIRKSLAFLARSLRTDPEYRPAAPLTVSILRDHNHVVSEQIELQSDGPIKRMNLIKGGDRIVTLSTNGTAQLWKTEPMELLRTMKIPGGITLIKYSENEDYMVTWNPEGSVHTWLTATGEPVGSPIRPSGWIYALRLGSPPGGGLHLATITSSLSIRVWNGLTGAPITPAFQPPGNKIRKFVFGTHAEFVGGRFDTQWMIWNLRQDPPELNRFRNASMRTSFFSQKHGILFEGGHDSDEFVASDMMTGREIFRIPLKGRKFGNPAWISDEKRVAVFAKISNRVSTSRRTTRAITNRATMVFDVLTGKIVNDFQIPSATAVPQVDPSGRRTLEIVDVGRLELRSLENGRLIKSYPPRRTQKTTR